MTSAKLNFVTVALISLAVFLMLALERPRTKNLEQLSVEREGRVAQLAAYGLTPAEKVTADTEKLARFKARVASLGERPASGFSLETNATLETQSLRTRKGLMETMATGLASQEELINHLATTLAVPPAFTVNEAKQIASDSDGTSQYKPYFAAVRERANRERMHDLLRMQIMHEELSMQFMHEEHQ